MFNVMIAELLAHGKSGHYATGGTWGWMGRGRLAAAAIFVKTRYASGSVHLDAEPIFSAHDGTQFYCVPLEGPCQSHAGALSTQPLS